MRPETASLIALGRAPKGDVVAAARLAGIMGAKRTSELIPLCHPIALDRAHVDVEVDDAQGIATITATALAHDRTGVEMEAMTAASVAALTLYDMLKGIERGITIERVWLLEKSGGKSGRYVRGGRMSTTAITEDALDVAKAIDAVRDPSAGAVATFVGCGPQPRRRCQRDQARVPRVRVHGGDRAFRGSGRSRG